MGIFQEQVKNKVDSEGRRNNLVDEYGAFWFVAHYVVGSMLAVIGAAADGIVLFSLFYLSTNHIVGSAVVAVVAAVVIQLLMGSSLFRAAKNYRRADYKKQGFATMLYGLGGMAIFLLVISLLLSLQTGSVVEAVGEYMIERNKKDISNETSYYDARIDSLQRSEQQAVVSLQQAANSLQQDKVTHNGEVVTRWHASKESARIMREDIPAVRDRYAAEIAAVRADRDAAKAEVKSDNAALLSKWEGRVEMGKQWTVGANLMFNFLRCVLISFFAAFIVSANNKQQQGRQQSPTPVTTTVGSVGSAVPLAVAEDQGGRRFAGFDIPAKKTEDHAGSRLDMDALRAELMAEIKAAQQSPTPPTQQPPTPVATTVEAVVDDPGGGVYNVTVVDGEPRLPVPDFFNSKYEFFTLRDVTNRIPTYRSRTTANGQKIYTELLKMEAALTAAKSKL